MSTPSASSRRFDSRSLAFSSPVTSACRPTERYRSASAVAWSAKPVLPESARAPRQVCRPASCLARRLSSGFVAGAEPRSPCARRTPRTAAQSAPCCFEVALSCLANERVSRADAGVGSGRARLSQIVGSPCSCSISGAGAGAAAARSIADFLLGAGAAEAAGFGAAALTAWTAGAGAALAAREGAAAGAGAAVWAAGSAAAAGLLDGAGASGAAASGAAASGAAASEAAASGAAASGALASGDGSEAGAASGAGAAAGSCAGASAVVCGRLGLDRGDVLLGQPDHLVAGAGGEGCPGEEQCREGRGDRVARRLASRGRGCSWRRLGGRRRLIGGLVLPVVAPPPQHRREHDRDEAEGQKQLQQMSVPSWHSSQLLRDPGAGSVASSGAVSFDRAADGSIAALIGGCFSAAHSVEGTSIVPGKSPPEGASQSQDAGRCSAGGITDANRTRGRR